jgi:hypothetical protein
VVGPAHALAHLRTIPLLCDSTRLREARESKVRFSYIGDHWLHMRLCCMMTTCTSTRTCFIEKTQLSRHVQRRGFSYSFPKHLLFVHKTSIGTAVSQFGHTSNCFQGSFLFVGLYGQSTDGKCRIGGSHTLRQLWQHCIVGPEPCKDRTPQTAQVTTPNVLGTPTWRPQRFGVLGTPTWGLPRFGDPDVLKRYAARPRLSSAGLYACYLRSERQRLC